MHTIRLAILGVAVMVSGCERADEPEEIVLRGASMGTAYSVKVVATDLHAVALQSEIDAVLERIERLMSTYDPASELSRFNRHESDEPFHVSPETLAVVRAAADLHRSTGGCFDPTVGPLVELWGFGSREPVAAPPPDERIAECLGRVGMQRLTIGPGARLSKSVPGLQLDLSAIAKGYAADRVAVLLEARGIRDLMVEIGGEIVVRGRNRERRRWRLGIEAPDDGPGGRALLHKLQLRDAALATSGDYRAFFLHEGVRYSHCIDPRTGRPVSEVVKSVSVVAPTCMLADGAATAIMVFGPERGLAWAEARDDLEALLVVRRRSGETVELATSGMGAFLAD